MPKKLSELEPGDTVMRWLVGCTTPMPMLVERITETRIICAGGWEFDLATGMEVDEEIGWGPGGISGSWLETPDERDGGFAE